MVPEPGTSSLPVSKALSLGLETRNMSIIRMSFTIPTIRFSLVFSAEGFAERDIVVRIMSGTDTSISTFTQTIRFLDVLKTTKLSSELP